MSGIPCGAVVASKYDEAVLAIFSHNPKYIRLLTWLNIPTVFPKLCVFSQLSNYHFTLIIYVTNGDNAVTSTQSWSKSSSTISRTDTRNDLFVTSFASGLR